jgi:hypothetical protein
MLNWTIRSPIINNEWTSVIHGMNLFVAVASSGFGNRVMTSVDGINWNIRNSAANNDWTSVTYGNGLFVAVACSGFGNRVMTSDNGINWVIRNSSANNNWNSVIYGKDLSGNNIFVAVASSGFGRVMTSYDGINWTTKTSAVNNDWTSITYGKDLSGNNIFVAVASSGFGNRVMTSYDGNDWVARNSAADYIWTSVTYGNGLFVAVASSGIGNRVMTSPDGINWTLRNSVADNNWNSITYGNDLFVAVSSSGICNRIMESSDGINWTSNTMPINNDWTSVTYNNGLFIAVASSGNGNRIITSYTQVIQKQSILSNFNIQNKNYGDPSFIIIPPTSNSDGRFKYSSSNESVAKINDNIIIIINVGTSNITATQEETIGYKCNSISTEFIVNKATPTLSNFYIPEIVYRTVELTIQPPLSNSDGPFKYISSNESVATINGNKIINIKAGITYITAIQEETSNYNSNSITAILKVHKAMTILTNFKIRPKKYGDTSFIITRPLSNNGGKFKYLSSDDSIATITENTINIINAGVIDITATQLGDHNHESNSISTKLIINKAIPSLSNFEIPEKTYGSNAFTIKPPTTNSNGQFKYFSSNELVATIDYDIINIVGLGITDIVAIQEETNNYESGSISTTFIVN